MSSKNEFYKSFIVPAIATAVILLIPFFAMQFNISGVDWSPFDFIVAGILIFGTGFTYKMVTRKKSNTIYRMAVGLSLSTVFLLIWINLAVGIIGSENNSANLMYLGVIAVVFLGSIIALGQPKGMSFTMLAASIATMLVPTIALFIWNPEAGSTQEVAGIMGVFVLNAFFAMLFVGSALLFRHAAKEQTPASIS